MLAAVATFSADIHVSLTKKDGGWRMTLRDNFKEPLALVILNASRDAVLREARAKALNDAGYYTTSAETPEEAITLATQMKCAVAIVCDSFTMAERRLIHMRIQRAVPATTVLFLANSDDNNAQILISAVRAALALRSMAHFRHKAV